MMTQDTYSIAISAKMTKYNGSSYSTETVFSRTLTEEVVLNLPAEMVETIAAASENADDAVSPETIRAILDAMATAHMGHKVEEMKTLVISPPEHLVSTAPVVAAAAQEIRNQLQASYHVDAIDSDTAL